MLASTHQPDATGPLPALSQMQNLNGFPFRFDKPRALAWVRAVCEEIGVLVSFCNLGPSSAYQLGLGTGPTFIDK